MPTGILEKDYDLPQRSKQDNHDERPGMSGLSQEQAEKLLEQYGENIIQEDKKPRPLKIFAGQFKDLMVMILLAAAGISAFIGEPADAVTIIIIVMLRERAYRDTFPNFFGTCMFSFPLRMFCFDLLAS